MTFCPEAVIFDMDGLLVDSEPVWMIADRELLTARGLHVDETIHHSLTGLRMNDFWTHAAERYGIQEEPAVLIDEVVSRMHELIPIHVTPRPGAPELLAFLRERGVPCAVASSSPNAIINDVLASQRWDDYFSIRCSGDEVETGKPAPDIYLEAARRLGVNPTRCLALEDSPNGARAAVAAGMICYAVPDLSHTTHAAFRGITPHVYEDLHLIRAGLEQCCFG